MNNKSYEHRNRGYNPNYNYSKGDHEGYHNSRSNSGRKDRPQHQNRNDDMYQGRSGGYLTNGQRDHRFENSKRDLGHPYSNKPHQFRTQ